MPYSFILEALCLQTYHSLLTISTLWSAHISKNLFTKPPPSLIAFTMRPRNGCLKIEHMSCKIFVYVFFAGLCAWLRFQPQGRWTIIIKTTVEMCTTDITTRSTVFVAAVASYHMISARNWVPVFRHGSNILTLNFSYHFFFLRLLEYGTRKEIDFFFNLHTLSFSLLILSNVVCK